MGNRSPPPNFRQPMHRHKDCRLIVFLSGETVEEGFAGVCTYGAGDFMFRPAHFAHADRTGPLGGVYAALRVTRSVLRRHCAAHGWRAFKGNLDLTSLDLERRLALEDGGDDLLTLLKDPASRRCRLPQKDHHNCGDECRHAEYDHQHRSISSRRTALGSPRCTTTRNGTKRIAPTLERKKFIYESNFGRATPARA